MRLINTLGLTLEEFDSEEGLTYAILSHRWDDGEVTYKEMRSAAGRCQARSKKGFEKIESFCFRARVDGFDYAWVDTCRIDKRSSSELTEAINSMYRWYEKSARCYVFLSDVRVEAEVSSTEQVPESFYSSQWFTRGWTLQELLAPESVSFYDQEWMFIGTEKTLKGVINLITHIDTSVLDGGSVYSCPISQRMSWASGRFTRRIEDRAYSLMGLFKVNMPLLYGEGEKAFLRLQEEIIRQSDDHTIFAWMLSEGEYRTGLLAKSPAAFADSLYMRRFGTPRSRTGYPYSMTNRGISITLELTPWARDTYIALLECSDYSSTEADIGEPRRAGIFLSRMYKDDQYARIKLDGDSCAVINYTELRASEQSGQNRPVKFTTICIREDFSPFDVFGSIYGYRICHPNLSELAKDVGFRISHCDSWDIKTGLLRMSTGRFGRTAIINSSKLAPEIQELMLGFDFDFNPVLCFSERTSQRSQCEDTEIGEISCFDERWIKGQLKTCTIRGVEFKIYKGGRINGILALHPVGDGKDGSIRNNLRISIQLGKFRGQSVWEVCFEK